MMIEPASGELVALPDDVRLDISGLRQSDQYGLVERHAFFGFQQESARGNVADQHGLGFAIAAARGRCKQEMTARFKV